MVAFRAIWRIARNMENSSSMKGNPVRLGCCLLLDFTAALLSTVELVAESCFSTSPDLTSPCCGRAGEAGGADSAVISSSVISVPREKLFSLLTNEAFV